MGRLVFLSLLLTACFYSKNAYSQDLTSVENCQYFYNQLKEIPHVELTQDSVIYESLINGKQKKGCQIKFVTTDSLSAKVEFPDFTRSIKNSRLYDLGWRYNETYRADGPGTGLQGIENSGVLCLISYAQPVNLVEDRKIESSVYITINVQCGAKKELGSWN